MRTWFAKQVQDAQPVPPVVESPAQGLAVAPDKIKAHTPRRMVYAPVLAGASADTEGSTIRIKAQLDLDGAQIVFMIDRPVLGGYSYYTSDRASAAEYSPLAAVLLEQSGVKSALIHEMNVTLAFNALSDASAESIARQCGQTIRAHLESGHAVMADAFLANMPSEDVIRDGLQGAIDDEINPGIAGHSGEITITAIVGNTAYIKMGGGCQGCAASGITLRHGVDQSFRRAVPQLGALLDETDHSAGSNPFFTELPAEMSA